MTFRFLAVIVLVLACAQTAMAQVSVGSAAPDDADFVDGTTPSSLVGGVAEIAAPTTVTEGDSGAFAMTLNRALKAALYAAGGTALSVGSGTEADSLRVAVATDSTISLESNSGVDIGDVDILSMPADATELPAAASLTDNMANPTTPLVGAALMSWDGATWDRAQLASDSVFGTSTYTETTTTGPAVGCARNDVLGELAGTDNEIAPCQVNDDGAMYVQPSAGPSGGGDLSRYISDGATEDEHAICTGACNLYDIVATNSASTVAYLKCHNDTVANTDPATDIIHFSAAIPGATTGGGFTATFPVGKAFSTALTCWIVTGAADSDVTEVGANEVMVNYTYKQ